MTGSFMFKFLTYFVYNKKYIARVWHVSPVEDDNTEKHLLNKLESTWSIIQVFSTYLLVHSPILFSWNYCEWNNKSNK